MARFKQVTDLLAPSENLASCDYYDVNDIIVSQELMKMISH